MFVLHFPVLWAFRYTVLKSFIKDNNEDLYKDLETRETVNTLDDKMDSAATVTAKTSVACNRPRSGSKKEVFFTGTVVLHVKKNSKRIYAY